jgi:hypothetical protein
MIGVPSGHHSLRKCIELVARRLDSMNASTITTQHDEDNNLLREGLFRHARRLLGQGLRKGDIVAKIFDEQTNREYELDETEWQASGPAFPTLEIAYNEAIGLDISEAGANALRPYLEEQLFRHFLNQIAPTAPTFVGDGGPPITGNRISARDFARLVGDGVPLPIRKSDRYLNHLKAFTRHHASAGDLAAIAIQLSSARPVEIPVGEWPYLDIRFSTDEAFLVTEGEASDGAPEPLYRNLLFDRAQVEQLIPHFEYFIAQGVVCWPADELASLDGWAQDWAKSYSRRRPPPIKLLIADWAHGLATDAPPENAAPNTVELVRQVLQSFDNSQPAVAPILEGIAQAFPDRLPLHLPKEKIIEEVEEVAKRTIARRSFDRAWSLLKSASRRTP